MDTIKRIINTNILFVLVLLSVAMISCNQDGLLYKITVFDFKSKDNCYAQSLIIIPICNNKDSVYCCINPRYFYRKIGVYIINEEDFSKIIYEKIVHNDFIRISDSVFFEMKKSHNIVMKDEKIFNFYITKGIFEVLKKYTNRYGELDYDNLSIDEMNYIYYLAFINDIYFYWEDEGGPGYFLDNTILNQIKKNSD